MGRKQLRETWRILKWNKDEAIIIIIITTTIFIVLSSWPGHCESSLSSSGECRAAPSGRRPSATSGVQLKAISLHPQSNTWFSRLVRHPARSVSWPDVVPKGHRWVCFCCCSRFFIIIFLLFDTCQCVLLGFTRCYSAVLDGPLGVVHKTSSSEAVPDDVVDAGVSCSIHSRAAVQQNVCQCHSSTQRQLQQVLIRRSNVIVYAVLKLTVDDAWLFLFVLGF